MRQLYIFGDKAIEVSREAMQGQADMSARAYNQLGDGLSQRDIAQAQQRMMGMRLGDQLYGMSRRRER